MFRLAARAGMAQGVRNVTWALGADSGGVAVVANGAPLWLQDSAWPRSPNGHAPSGIVRKADGSCQGQTMRQSGGESGSRAMPWSVNRDP